MNSNSFKTVFLTILSIIIL